MPSVPIAAPNIFANPTTVSLTGNLSVPATAKFAVKVVPDQAGRELTVSNQQTKYVFNPTAFDVTLKTTGNADVTLGGGGAYFVMWDQGATGHELANAAGGGAAIQPVTATQNTLPANGSPFGHYSVQQGANRGLYFSTGVGAPIRLITYPVDGSWPV